MSELFRKQIFDTIHGNITLTRTEDDIVETAYYQRLRWIRQLGFTFYIYPGATHTRFSHALGVLHVMDRVLKGLGIAVPDERLFNPRIQDEKTVFHRTMRLAALLHDVGTFPFSHTIELAYINHSKKQQRHGVKAGSANHEALGKKIIQQTDFEGGITKLLKDGGIDPVFLSQVIAGTSSNTLANQLVHSDIDADRMDYLLRDAHFTGLNFGKYDLDQLIRYLTLFEVDGQTLFGVKEEGMKIAEYFLISRFYWYSQIIDDGTGYKFDLIAAKIHEYFLEMGIVLSYEDISNDVVSNPYRYFTFNDSYFISKVHEFLANPKAHPHIRELCELLAFRQPPKQIKISPVEPTLIQSPDHRAQVVKKVTETAQWLESELKRLDPDAWMIFDIPHRDVMFTLDMKSIVKDQKGSNLLLARDPVKVVNRHGEPQLLIQASGSLFGILNQYRNFIPRIYVSAKSLDLLSSNGILSEMKRRSAL